MMFDRAQVAAALPGYELREPLGRGGFGLVLAGRHRRLDRDVAIKILDAGPDARADFAAEAPLLAKMDHQHLVRVHDYVRTDDLHLIVMEFLGGGTLTDRRKTGLSAEGACAVGLAVAEALSYMHTQEVLHRDSKTMNVHAQGQGVLHRDIKTDNILFDDAGQPKVTDFGLAKIFDGVAAKASRAIGTPGYMAPEQILTDELSPATDLYALGVVLYLLLAGKPPFNPTPPKTLLQRCLDTIPDPPAGVPAPVADVIMQALAKNPADRQPSAHAFALDLARATTVVYGPGWTTRTGIPLHLADDIRAASEQTFTPARRSSSVASRARDEIERVAAVLPGYELRETLGRDGFGLVLAGRHRGLNRPVAIKILAAGHDGAEAGFATEAQLLAAMDHPHVVRVHDYVRTDDLHLIVMELLGGGTLTRHRSGIPPEGACAVGLAVAAALAAAHARGVLHRNIKPDNILFDSAGLLKVTDFGIVKLLEGSTSTASAVIGTMAPEQILAGRLGPATDLYALGCVLYQLLAGRPPFDPALPLPALWQQRLNTLPPPPTGVPTPVADVVMRVLATDPADRQPSARAFALDLARAAAYVYGPGWTTRARIPLHLDDDIRAATDHPPSPPLVPLRSPAWPGTTKRDRPARSRGSTGRWST